MKTTTKPSVNGGAPILIEKILDEELGNKCRMYARVTIPAGSIYSNEHTPEHVHVKKDAGKAKFDLSDGVQLVESKGMKVSELKRAQEIAEEEVTMLKEKWHEFFD